MLHNASCLPLMREVTKICDFWRRERKYILSPSHLLVPRKCQPLVRGGRGIECIYHFGMVMVSTIWLSVSRRSEMAEMPKD